MTLTASSKARRGRTTPVGDRQGIGDALVGGGLRPEPLTGLVAIFVLYLTAAAAGVALLPLAGITSQIHAALIGLCIVVAAIGWLTLRLRTRSRQQVCDRAIEGLSRHLQLRTPDRAACRARRWRGGWIGTPEKVVWRYGPPAPCTDGEWRDHLVAETGRRFGATYRLARDKPRHRRVVLVRDETTAEVLPASVRRIESFSQQIFGVKSVVKPTFDDSAELAGFEVSNIESVKFADRAAQGRAERKMSNLMPQRWRAHFDVTRDVVKFEIRPTFPESVWLPTLDIDTTRDVLSTYDEVAIPYAVDEDGTEMVWRPAIQPNLMLIGVPGSGKTVTAHTLLVQASRYGWPIWVVDGKAIEFLGFQDWPNVQIVATNVPEQVAVIEKAHAVMEQRYDLVTSGRARESDFEPLLVFLDEWADFRANVLAWYAEVKPSRRGAPSKPRVLEWAASMARKGRSSRVHLVFGTQRPDAVFFTGDMRDNFPTMISMGRLSPQAAMMVWQNPVTGTTVPRLCRGRATTVNHDGHPVEAQCFRTPDPRKITPGDRQSRMLNELRPAEAKHDRLLIVPPEDDPDTAERLEENPDQPLTYFDYAAAQWVLASDRRDLDPVAHREQPHENSRELASPMSILGLRELTTHPPDETAAAYPAALPPPEPGGAPALRVVPDVAEDDPGEPEHDGYTPQTEAASRNVSPGDLILVDEHLDHWAVVEHADEDLIETNCMAISWRDDHGDDGELTIDQDETVTIRRPDTEQSA